MTGRNRIKAYILAALIMPFFVFAANSYADTLGQAQVFNTNSKYDRLARTNISTTLRAISSHAYFYVDNNYWDGLTLDQQNSFNTDLNGLAQDFDNNIYPKETQFWGSEPNPGIDGDPRLTVLAEDLAQGNGGYFDAANEFTKRTAPDSNQREMIFINAQALSGNVGAGSSRNFLAHEFQHLISFNQKEVRLGIKEDVWLNELRSEYSITLVGYNDIFENSNLQRRASAFLDDPTDSLPEWPNVSADYDTANMFGEYLTEQYGSAILTETLQSPYSGITSINQYLAKHNYQERFSDIFENWTVANYLNETFRDSRYGYSRSELKNIHVLPSQAFVSYPTGAGENYSLKPWQGNWSQFYLNNLPDSKSVKIAFTSVSGIRAVYADNLGRVGVINYPTGYISNPGGLRSFVLMPVNESKLSDFSASETAIPVSAVISFVDAVPSQIIDGSLIKRPGEAEMYVVEGKYRRYLSPEVIKLYGQLDPSKAVELDDAAFNSYTTANYVRDVNDKKVYAVWPPGEGSRGGTSAGIVSDGTKHWLNMTGEYFTQSGRDWNSIFIINDSEFNYYKIGADIKQ